ncbi:MAG: glycine cleavage system protein H [Bdellovibrionota bacterium]
MSDVISYMGYEWITVENGVVTIGISEDAAEDLSEDLILTLPEQDDVVMAGKVCGDIESENGNLNIYSPVSGTVIEVNDAVLENPALIFEDPTDEGWLFKVEADDADKLDQISLRAKSFEDDDEDDDDEDDDDLDEDDEGDSKDRDED